MYTIYSKENCSQCNMAVTLLNMKRQEFTKLMLDVDYTRDDITQYESKVRSFPIILKDGEFLGSLAQLKDDLK